MHNAPDEVLDSLHYWHKSLEPDPNRFGARRTVKERVPLYRSVEPGIHVTYQGLLDDVVAECKKLGITPVVHDKRIMLPPPNMLAAGGFRHSQRELFFNMVAKHRSGLCKAPTRYGKTSLVANILRVYQGVRAVVTAPGVDLINQLVLDLKGWLPGRDIRPLHSKVRSKKPSPDITVCSIDSLEQCEPETVDLLLVDEPHASAAPSRFTKFALFSRARVLGFTATPTGRFDGADVLVRGTIGPVLVERTYQEAVAEGAICPITVYVLKVKFNIWNCFDRDQAYKRLIYKNEQFNELVQNILHQQVPADWQSIVFVSEVKQAELIQRLVDDGVVAVASKMSKTLREETYRKMVSAEIKRCIATNIYSTGLTFPDLRAIVNAAGGGGSISSTQKPGRLAQMRPGKKCGYVIDFMFEPAPTHEAVKHDGWQAVVHDCWTRFQNYKKAGFDVRLVNHPSEILLD